MTGRTRTSSVECSSGTPLAGEGRSNDTGSAHIVSLGYAFWKSKVLLTAVDGWRGFTLIDTLAFAHPPRRVAHDIRACKGEVSSEPH